MKKLFALCALLSVNACGTNQFPENSTAVGGLLGGIAGAVGSQSICGTTGPICGIAGSRVGTAVGQTVGTWEQNRTRNQPYVGQGAVWGNPNAPVYPDYPKYENRPVRIN